MSFVTKIQPISVRRLDLGGILFCTRCTQELVSNTGRDFLPKFSRKGMLDEGVPTYLSTRLSLERDLHFFARL
jgi:hypothetical protein